MVQAADEQEAKRIVEEHEAEHAEAQMHLEAERRRTSVKSVKRRGKRRLKYALAALHGEMEGKSEDEVRRLLDPNGDGIVELDELWGTLQGMSMASGHAMTRDDAQNIMRELEASGEAGRVSVEEMME